MKQTTTPVLGPDGRPARPAKTTDPRCPGTVLGRPCTAGPEKRVASGGFGRPHPVCGVCGHQFVDEEWTG